MNTMTKQQKLRVMTRAQEKIAAEMEKKLGRQLTWKEAKEVARDVRKEMKIK